MTKAATTAETGMTSGVSMTTHWPVHPIAMLFPSMTPEERGELKVDMRERVERGLDPLEHPIVKYDDQILDGRHRDEVWIELAEEDACGGFFKRNLPPTESVSSDRQGTLAAWMRAKSANMIHRDIPADQKAAIFLKAVETFPEVRAVVDQIKDENTQRRKEGKPLVAGDQRGNTAEQIGDLAGAGATTVKEVAKLQKEAPEVFEEVAQGKTSAKKAVKELKKKRKRKASTAKEPSGTKQDATVLDELRSIGERLKKVVSMLDMVNWSEEDPKEWDKAGDAVSQALVSISGKAQAGFKSATKGKANPRMQRRQAEQKEISSGKLKALYGDYAVEVVEEYLDELPRKKGTRPTYKIVKPLPTEDEFQQRQRTMYTSSVADQVDNAFGVLEELASEVGDWYDSLPESLKGGDKGSALEDARSTLENLAQPDVDEKIGTLPVYYLPLRKVSSRASRRDDAVGRLNAVVDALGTSEDQEAKDLISELENAIGEAEGVEFPGMY